MSATVPVPASPETFAAMLAIAKRVAAEHTMTAETRTYTPRVVGKAGQVFITVPQNAVLGANDAQALLTDTRKAVLDAWTAEGNTTGQRTQRARGGGKTWVHTSGFSHMGAENTSCRFAILVPRAA